MFTGHISVEYLRHNVKVVIIRWSQAVFHTFIDKLKQPMETVKLAWIFLVQLLNRLIPHLFRI